MAGSTGSGAEQRSVGTFSSPCFNRLVRTRMLGGVGRAGVMPTLTRLGCSPDAANRYSERIELIPHLVVVVGGLTIGWS